MLLLQRTLICFFCLIPLVATGCGSNEVAEQTAEEEAYYESEEYEAQMLGETEDKKK